MEDLFLYNPIRGLADNKVQRGAISGDTARAEMLGLARLPAIILALNSLHIVSAVTQITFLHWNDQHARVEPADNSGGTCKDLIANNNASLCFGGYARLGTFFKQVHAL